MAVYKCPLEEIPDSLANLNLLRKESRRCDFELRSGKTRLACHAVVLEYRVKLPQFTSEESFYECVSSVSAVVLESFLQFVYTYQTEITIDTVFGLLQLSREFEAKQLHSLCSQFLASVLVTEWNWQFLCELSCEFELPAVRQKVILYLAENFDRYRDEEEFLELDDTDLLKAVLSSDYLVAFKEKDVLDAVKRWITYDEERALLAGDILQCVRLPMIQDLSQCSTDLMAEPAFNSYECNALISTAVDYITYPSMEWSLQSTTTRPRLCQDVKEVLIAVIPSSTAVIHYWDKRLTEWYPITKKNPPSQKFADLRLPSTSVVCWNSRLYMIDSERQAMYSCTDVYENFWNVTHRKFVARAEAACVVADEKIFIIGGRELGNKQGGSRDTRLLSLVEAIDPISPRVFTIAALPFPVLRPCLFSTCGKIIAIGGFDGQKNVAHAQVYDCSEDKWTYVKDAFPESDQRMSAACHGGVVYVLASSGKLYTFDIGMLKASLFLDLGVDCASSSMTVYRNMLTVFSPKQGKTYVLDPEHPQREKKLINERRIHHWSNGQRVHLFCCLLPFKLLIQHSEYRSLFVHESTVGQEIHRLQKQYAAECNVADWKAGKFTLLHYACCKGDTTAVCALLQRGADVHAKTTKPYNYLQSEFDAGTPPIHMAIQEYHFDVMTVLLEFGAVNSVDDKGRTNLHVACKRGGVCAAAAILDTTADVDVRDCSQLTPLIMACDQVDPTLAKMLFNRGASANIVGNSGLTPLMLTCNDEIVKMLLSRGVNVNATLTADFEFYGVIFDAGCSALHFAAARAQYDVVYELLQAGANACLKNAAGWTPLDEAIPGESVHHLISNYANKKSPAGY